LINVNPFPVEVEVFLTKAAKSSAPLAQLL
jgi:hypothetical protein